jgi:hypothetical protein
MYKDEEKKGFFAKIFGKVDKRMKEKTAKSSCCCCSSEKPKENKDKKGCC